MRILCLDDERRALKMLVNCVKKVKPDAGVEAFDDNDPGVPFLLWIM